MLHENEEEPELSSGSLARRLNLLLDTAIAADGSKYGFAEVGPAMEAAGTPLSASQWQSMCSGDGPAVNDPQLLSNLARFFSVDGQYLMREDAETPERIDAQLDLLKSMRAAKVRNFAARQLDGISAGALREIRSTIDQHMAAGPKS